MKEDKAAGRNLRREFIGLSVKSYIALRPPVFLGYDYSGIALQRAYTIEDFAAEIGITKEAVARWKKLGRIPREQEALLIKKKVLPRDWRMFK